MSNNFEREVTVEAHGKYDSFRGSDKVFYKPVGEGLTVSNFEIGKSYKVKGYSSDTGKTNYIVELLLANSKVVAAPAVKAGAKMPKPDAPKAKAKDKDVDWNKIAKGKTFSLIVAGLTHSEFDLGILEGRKALLEAADDLLKGIEDRGYFT